MEPGTRLDHYRVLEKLGEGGMGAVYRADDTQLDRQVAIKVLPPELADDGERLARLEREARLLASLNHPNVATLHGLGDAELAGDGPGGRRVRFLVMELVEGRALRQRLSEGPMSLPEALDVAVQIAKGLEAAHERGIVHRDLKPGNVQLCPDGTVKVLDFGLAKALEPDGSGSDGSPELSASPTMAAATGTGVILGTAAYMSPEQARGKPVDRRTDIWAWGCVLYEMITGRKPFDGDTVSDVLASILKEEPNLDDLPATVPRRLSDLLARCLEKDPARRLRDIGDARLEAEAARDEPPRPVAAPEAASLRSGKLLGLGALLLLLGLAAGWWLGGGPTAGRPLYAILGTDVGAVGAHSLAISSDGRTVAVAEDGRVRVRRLDRPDWTEIPVEGEVLAVALSDDGDRVFFSRGREIWTSRVDGSARLLMEGNVPIYAQMWGEGDGRLLMTGVDPPARQTVLERLDPRRGAIEELWRTPFADGLAVLITGILDGDRMLGWRAAPGRRSSIGILRRDDGEADGWLAGYASPTVAPDGRILAVDQRGRLLSMERQGDSLVDAAVPLADGLAVGLSARYAVSSDGTLVYLAGGATEDTGAQPVWLARSGAVEQVGERTRPSDADSRISPDGRHVALETRTESRPIEVWIHDLDRDVLSPLLPDTEASFPVWSPDGSELLVASPGIDGGPPGIYRAPVDRASPPTLVRERPENEYLFPMDWSPDGSTLLYVRTRHRFRAEGSDLRTLPLEGGEPEVFLATPANEVDGRYSPDGRWIAFRSDQSGRNEIYLRSVDGGGEVTVSGDGGRDPEWDADGTLYYVSGSRVQAVEVSGGETPSPAPARQIVEIPENAGLLFAPAPDGQRFLVNVVDPGNTSPSELRAIFNAPGIE